METEEEFEVQEVKSNLKNSEMEYSKKSRNSKRGLVKLEEGKDSALRGYHHHHHPQYPQDVKNIESGATVEYR